MNRESDIVRTEVHNLSREERVALLQRMLKTLPTPDDVTARFKQDAVFAELLRAHPHMLPKGVSGELLCRINPEALKRMAESLIKGGE